jgi:hypothetical protein
MLTDSPDVAIASTVESWSSIQLRTIEPKSAKCDALRNDNDQEDQASRRQHEQRRKSDVEKLLAHDIRNDAASPNATASRTLKRMSIRASATGRGLTPQARPLTTEQRRSAAHCGPRASAPTRRMQRQRGVIAEAGGVADWPNRRRRTLRPPGTFEKPFSRLQMSLQNDFISGLLCGLTLSRFLLEFDAEGFGLFDAAVQLFEQDRHVM